MSRRIMWHLIRVFTVCLCPIYRTRLKWVNTVELQWLEHLWDHENEFETGVVRANEG